MPMALPRDSRGKMSRIRVKTIGMMMPVAMAIITRASRRTPKLGASAATTEASANQAMPPMKSLRVLKRPIKKALRGMTTASTIE